LNATVDAVILKRFEIGDKIGEGSYGIVWKATDKRTQTVVALKKQVDAFRNRKDAQRTMREILTLRKLYGRSPNIIGLQEVLKGADSKDIYLVMDCMEGDLSKLPEKVQLKEQEHARIMFQILSGLNNMHRHECLHRDIKPSNILCNDRGQIVKLGDLGLARTIESLEAEAENEDPEDIRNSTGSLWYMAPEALLGSHVVSKPSDVWAVGCVMGEMLGVQPLFRGGSKSEVLARITQLVGKPDEEYIKELEDNGNLPAALVIERLPQTQSIDWDKCFPSSSAEASALLRKLLIFHPNKRITAADALKDPWFKTHLGSAELGSESGSKESGNAPPPEPLKLPLDGPELHTVEEYQAEVWKEIQMHYEQPRSGCCAVA